MPFPSYHLLHNLIGSDGCETQQLEATLPVMDIRAAPKNTRRKPSRGFSTARIDTLGQKPSRISNLL